MTIAVPTPTSRRRRAAAAVAVTVSLSLVLSACINNGTWSAAPAPVVPVQALDTSMADVSCVTEDWCLAVGTMGSYPLAEVWDGTAWSVVTAPSLDNLNNTRVESVDCGTPTSCVARVIRTYPNADMIDFVVGWDGTGWQDLAGSEGPYVNLLPASCAPDGTCLVVDNRGEETMIWEGGAVTRIPFATTRPPWDVNDIDCLAGDLCIAATSYSSAVWNGTTWSELPGSDTTGIFAEGARSIACSGAADCLAVGPGAGLTGPTSATWDGSTWTEVPLPPGLFAVGELECVGTSECLLRALDYSSSFLLAWLAGGWHPAPSSPDGIGGMSCLPQHCLAVGGNGTPTTPEAATYTWTNA